MSVLPFKHNKTPKEKVLLAFYFCEMAFRSENVEIVFHRIVNHGQQTEANMCAKTFIASFPKNHFVIS